MSSLFPVELYQQERVTRGHGRGRVRNSRTLARYGFLIQRGCTQMLMGRSSCQQRVSSGFFRGTRVCLGPHQDEAIDVEEGRSQTRGECGLCQLRISPANICEYNELRIHTGDLYTMLGRVTKKRQPGVELPKHYFGCALAKATQFLKDGAPLPFLAQEQSFPACVPFLSFLVYAPRSGSTFASHSSEPVGIGRCSSIRLPFLVSCRVFSFSLFFFADKKKKTKTFLENTVFFFGARFGDLLASLR